ncbi:MULTISPECIES: hypothetical protein [Vibrio]|uniref:DUF4336 domain-containing protein n=1 Tax=Vibrio algicola TaxID=2662262 RepID=A0A5Q0TL52_9VIBR|nr:MULTISPECIES: hypothetical protein [Vibrio]MBD1577654.1 hypothetical protein [Vibrio sp. S11_S32]
MLIEWQKDRVWYEDMPYRKFGLTHIQRMIVVKLEQDKLLVISPIELNTQKQLELSKLGTVKAIISPTASYHQYLSEWWLAYSKAYFYATHALIEKRTDLKFDDVLSHRTPKLWQGQLLQTSIVSDDHPNKMIFCDPISRTLFVSNNLIAIQPHLPTGQKILTLAQGVNHELKLPFYQRRKFKNKARLRVSVQEVMTWPFDRLLSSNGLVIEKNAKDAFYQAFWWAFQ